jgi:hypothetical protein
VRANARVGRVWDQQRSGLWGPSPPMSRRPALQTGTQLSSVAFSADGAVRRSR